MEFLKIFSLLAVFLILVSIYNISNFMACKNYVKCIQHTMSGRIIILALVLSIAMLNKYLAALVVIFLAIFLFDRNEKYGVYDLYNCQIMEDKVKIDKGITERLDEKLSKKSKKILRSFQETEKLLALHQVCLLMKMRIYQNLILKPLEM